MSSKEKYEKAKELYAKGGRSQEDAAKEAGISVSVFAYYRAREAKAAAKAARRAKPKTAMKETLEATKAWAVPMPVSAAQLLVFRGSPAELAEIARAL